MTLAVVDPGGIVSVSRNLEGPREWLSFIVVVSLALYLLIGLVAWVWMILAGIEAPAAFGTVLAAIIGAFAGVLTPLRLPSGRGRETGEARSGTAPEPPPRR